jgi:hypothetical protein
MVLVMTRTGIASHILDSASRASMMMCCRMLQRDAATA